MCQHIIKKTGKQCKIKTEPYCYLHRTEYVQEEENDEKSETALLKAKLESLALELKQKDKQISYLSTSASSSGFDDCTICCESRSKFVVHSSCKNKVCNDCVIKSGKTSCPFCRGSMEQDIDPESLSLLNFIKEKDDTITRLNQDVLSLQVSARLLESQDRIGVLYGQLVELQSLRTDLQQTVQGRIIIENNGIRRVSPRR